MLHIQKKSTIKEHGTALQDDTLPAPVKFGIGGAVAIRFAQENYHVALMSRSIENLQPIQSVIDGLGGHAICVPCDVSSEKSVADAFQQGFRFFHALFEYIHCENTYTYRYISEN